MDNIVIVGSSGHARVVIDIVQRVGRYRIAGLLDGTRQVNEQTRGHAVLGSEEDLPALVAAHALRGIIVAIGDNFVRGRIVRRISALCPDLPWASAIHPSAVIADDAVIGDGTVVAAGAVINPGAVIGNCCIVNTGASLDHDSLLGDFASLAPGVVTGGNCRIGEFAAIGIGAVLVHGAQVGEHAVVGAASLVTGSVAPRVVAYGTPARTIRARQPGDKYL